MKKLIFATAVFLTIISCSNNGVTKEETQTTTTETHESTKTQVIINVVDVNNNRKGGYTVMMFEKKPVKTEILPTIIKQVDSNAKGIATFDLESYITTKKKLYFQVFLKVGEDYTWKGIYVEEVEISKNHKITTTILVN